MPSSLVLKVQATYPNVTAKQVHQAWGVISEELWKKRPNQLELAQVLLQEHQQVIDVFEIKDVPGVEQICWGLKVIIQKIIAKCIIVEIAIDATYNTNTMHLELYCVMAELDGAGFPLSYCLLSTTEAMAAGKKVDALERWTIHLHDKYYVNPEFINLDKDLGEIGMTQRVWPGSKIQICDWHIKKAVREWITKAKLSTTPYKVANANRLFPFIKLSFVPTG
uniref:MULE transposase domain-containing protein n=1 Tax=Moniliophthora roreri TaxID=221103 RepID=A0A0W0GCB2_MONRR